MTIEIGLLVFPRLQQLDLAGPYEVFASWPEARVHLVWKSRDSVTSSTGLTLTPTTTFADCPPLDVICVPGGAGVNALMSDEETLAFVRARAKEARFVTSVCTGALLLGAAGLLRGRRATTHWASLDLLSAFGAIPVKARVVRDGGLVTGGGVTAGIDFALTLVDALAGRDVAEAIQLNFEYAPEPPFAAGSPETVRPEIVARVRAASAEVRAERERLADEARRESRGPEATGQRIQVNKRATVEPRQTTVSLLTDFIVSFVRKDPIFIDGASSIGDDPARGSSPVTAAPAEGTTSLQG